MSQQKPLALRQAPSDDLGIVGGAADEAACSTAKPWVLHWAPPSWDQEDVLSFLQSQKWSAITVHARRRAARKGDPPVWPLRAVPPESACSLATHTFADGERSLFLGPPAVRPCRPSVAEKVPGPRRLSTSLSEAPAPAPAPAPTQLDGDGDVTIAESASAAARPDAKRASDQPTEAVGPAKHHRAPHGGVSGSAPPSGTSAAPLPGNAVDADDVLRLVLAETSAPASWSLRELRNNGDCGFLAAAGAIAWSQGLSLDSAELGRQAARLRLLAVGHMAKHEASYSPSWAPDSSDQPQMFGSRPIPTCWREYIGAAAAKGFWVDGLLMRALSERTGHPIIVFRFDPVFKAWSRGVVAPWFAHGSATGPAGRSPLALVLRDGHYRALLPQVDAPFPSGWLRETASISRAAWRGSGPGSGSARARVAALSVVGSGASVRGVLSLLGATPDSGGHASAGALSVLGATPQPSAASGGAVSGADGSAPSGPRPARRVASEAGLSVLSFTPRRHGGALDSAVSPGFRASRSACGPGRSAAAGLGDALSLCSGTPGGASAAVAPSRGGAGLSVLGGSVPGLGSDVVSATGGDVISVGGAGPSLGIGPSGVACLGPGHGGGASEARVLASLRVGAAGLPGAPGIGCVALDFGAATPSVGAAGGSPPRLGAGRSAPGLSAPGSGVSGLSASASVVLLAEPSALPARRRLLSKRPRPPEFPPPPGVGAFPSTEAASGRTLWWTCPLPGCCVRVFRHAVVRGHHEARRKHLSDHGLAPKDFPPLHDAGPKTKRRRTPAEAAVARAAKVARRLCGQLARRESPRFFGRPCRGAVGLVALLLWL